MKFIPVAVILGLLLVTFAIGLYYSQDHSIVKTTTMRSLFYGVVVEDVIDRGVGIIMPHYSGYSSDLIASQIISSIDENIPFFEVISSSSRQCTHSVFLEWLSDYGVIFFSIFMILTYLMTSTSNVYFVVFYMVLIGFQCEGFNPNIIFPFYIYYYLSSRLFLSNIPHKRYKFNGLRK